MSADLVEAKAAANAAAAAAIDGTYDGLLARAFVFLIAVIFLIKALKWALAPTAPAAPRQLDDMDALSGEVANRMERVQMRLAGRQARKIETHSVLRAMAESLGIGSPSSGDDIAVAGQHVAFQNKRK